MPDWVVLLLGLAILGMIYSDRRLIRIRWRRPSRWWVPREGFDARGPAEPLNLVVGLVLGVGAVVYGVVALIR